MGRDALVAPFHVRVEFLPLRLGALQCEAGQTTEFISSIFNHVGQRLAQIEGLLCNHQSKPGQQTTNAIGAGVALFFEAFTQAVDA